MVYSSYVTVGVPLVSWALTIPTTNMDDVRTAVKTSRRGTGDDETLLALFATTFFFNTHTSSLSLP